MKQNEVCVQFGCGLSSPEGWLNYDNSPTLRIQRLPVVGKLLTRNRVTFPSNVSYADVLKGLPHRDDSVDKIYCSHVLEHLSFEDFHKAVKEVHRCLKTGGEFRLVMPNLRHIAHAYLQSTDANAAEKFMRDSLLGLETRPAGFLGKVMQSFSNKHHLWLWDEVSTKQALISHGFVDVEQIEFSRSEDSSFSAVQDETRFIGAVAMTCFKP